MNYFKHSLLLIIIIGFSKMVAGQEQLTISNPFQFDEGYSTYIFADTALIRTAPGLTADIKDVLFAGDEITIVKASEIKTISSGKEAPWYQVSYLKNGAKRIGYIWGALLSFSAHRRGITKFVYGIDKVVIISNEHQYVDDIYIVIKVIENKVVKGRTQFKFNNSDSANYPSAAILDNKGLTNIKHVFKSTFSGNACAVPTYDFYILWNGKSIYPLPTLYSSADVVEEGVIGVNQEYIFPKDPGGKPGQIILSEHSSDYDKNDNIVEKDTYQYYFWNGQQLKRLSSNKKAK